MARVFPPQKLHRINLSYTVNLWPSSLQDIFGGCGCENLPGIGHLYMSCCRLWFQKMFFRKGLQHLQWPTCICPALPIIATGCSPGASLAARWSAPWSASAQQRSPSRGLFDPRPRPEWLWIGPRRRRRAAGQHFFPWGLWFGYPRWGQKNPL